ncbi:MAG TPA: hypothetical protein VGM18_21335 [Candidatus Sulfotelmatobacter sp.]
MPFSDTTPEAREVQFRIYRAMSGEQRLLLAYEMSMFARELARARIISDHPEWDEALVNRELLRIAFLPDPLPPGFR